MQAFTLLPIQDVLDAPDGKTKSEFSAMSNVAETHRRMNGSTT